MPRRAVCATLRGMSESVLIVDDHDGFRAFARSLLTSEGFDVVGEAGVGASAIRAAEQLGPDVVLLDVQPRDLHGFEFAERHTMAHVRPAAVVISTRAPH